MRGDRTEPTAHTALCSAADTTQSQPHPHPPQQLYHADTVTQHSPVTFAAAQQRRTREKLPQSREKKAFCCTEAKKLSVTQERLNWKAGTGHPGTRPLVRAGAAEPERGGMRQFLPFLLLPSEPSSPLATLTSLLVSRGGSWGCRQACATLITCSSL